MEQTSDYINKSLYQKKKFISISCRSWSLATGNQLPHTTVRESVRVPAAKYGSGCQPTHHANVVAIKEDLGHLRVVSRVITCGPTPHQRNVLPCTYDSLPVIHNGTHYSVTSSMTMSTSTSAPLVSDHVKQGNRNNNTLPGPVRKSGAQVRHCNLLT